MENLNPQELEKWIQVFWSVGSKGLLVFVVIVYKDLVIHAGKTIIDVFASWVKRK